MADLAQLHGILPPILTPLNDDETVDHASLRRLVDYVIAGGVHGIWVMGTTGEFPSFDQAERESVVRTTVEAAAGRVPVVAGIGDASTRLAIRNAGGARRAGADAIALTPPYYYSNSQDELVDHFRAIRDRVDLPLMVYNIPQTVKVKFEVPTVLRLAEERLIVGLKDSQNDLDWFRQVMTGARERGMRLRGFLGTRYLIDAGVLIGGHGAIPSFANVAPTLCVRCYEAAARGEWAEAGAWQERVVEAMGISTGIKGSATAALFSSMKAALKALGVLSTSRVCAPLRTVSAEEEALVARRVAALGLLETTTETADEHR
ncbi:MAG: dihydrodipicolinate synthase family protein [Chloroflexi bacterium]|nr:dihydrodipicolinate synthase family protein [Chloroflexota bacterium]